MRPICLPGDPQCPPPDVTITPAGGTVSTASQSVTIDWCGHTALSPASRQILLNGVDVTASFSYGTSAQAGCSSHASSTGTITLPAGTSTLTASIEDNIGQGGSDGAFFTLSMPAEGAIVSLTPHNGTNRNVALCVANCFDEVVTYAMPSYRSMDTDRSLTLLYRSAHAKPIATVTLDVRDTAAGKTASQISVKLLDANNAPVTLRNGLPERVFTNQSGATLRLAVQFDASALATGAYTYTAAVKSYYTDSSSRTTNRSVRVLVVNERSSPYGVGWSVAGLQRAYPTADGGLAVTDGTGSIQYFAGPCTTSPCSFTSPVGDYSVITRGLSPYGTIWNRQYPDGSIVGFSSGGLALYSEDRFGNHTSYAYNGYRLSSITDPVGRVINVAGTGSYTITDPAGRVSTVTLNGANNVIDIQDPVGGHPFTAPAFDSTGVRLAQWTDRRGGVWNADYDCSGHLWLATAPAIVADGGTTRPQTQLQHVDMQTAACAQAAPATAVLASAANASVKDARGNPTTYYVDAFLAPTKVYDVLGRLTTITRDSAARVRNVVTPSGHSVTSTWSGPNLTRSVDNTTGRTINYVYDSRYNLLTSASGHTPTIQNFLNAAGTAVDSAKVAGAAATKFKYDAKGRDTLTTDPEGHTTRTHYAAGIWNNTSDIEIGRGHTTSYSYDIAGRLELTVDALSNTTRAAYDDLNRLRWTIGPRGDTTSYAYDSLYLWKVTDALHQVYQYDRNALGWVETLTDPGARVEHYAYDLNGNVTSKTNRRGQTVTSTYDGLNRQLQLAVDPQRSTTFTYDPADRWLTAANAVSTDTIKFDVAGRRMVEIAQRLGIRLADTSQYNDTLGVRVSVAQPNAGTSSFVRYEYDASYQLSSLLTGGWYTNLGHNADRKASTLQFPSGVTQLNSYSSDHAKSSTSFSPAGSAVDVAFQVSTHQDSVGRVTERYHYADTSRVYSYDGGGQLTGYYDHILGSKSCHIDIDEGRVCTYPNEIILGGETYTYDRVGNRTDGVGTIDPGNRVRAFQGFALTYDADGNLVRKVKSGVADDSLEWNALGELTRMLRSGSVVAEFTYDGFGRRVTKTAGGVVTNYQWDDDHVALELDGSGNTIARYAFYPGVDKPHSVTTNAGTFAMTMETPGNVIGLMPYTANSVAAQYAYKPFGAMERNDQTVTNSLRFQGRPYDPETGLYYFRARYYDPMIARFVSEDPIGIAGGVNLYRFESNNPINSQDPYGLDDCRVSEKEACPIKGVTITPDDDDRESGYNKHPSARGSTPGVATGGGSGGSGAVAKSARPSCAQQTSEVQLSFGASAVAGFGLPGGFYGLGINWGVTSSGRAFVQFSGSVSVGAGAYVGAGTGLGGGVSAVTPEGGSVSSATLVQANAGLGPSVGASVAFENGTGRPSFARGAGRYGGGWGAMASIGEQATYTYASPSYPLLRQLFGNNCR